LVHDGDGPGPHGDDVAHDAADAGSRTLERFDEGGVVVALHLEGDGPALTDVDDPGVLADPDEEALTHPVAHLLADLPQVHLGALVGAVLAPHDGVHGEPAARGAAAEDLTDRLVLVV